MQSFGLLMLGVAVTGFGIYLTVKHPLKWRNYGIGMAIGGVGLNVLNFTAA